MISTLSSVLPPSTTMYSRLGYPWSSTERSVCSRYLPWLKLGVTTVMRGRVLMPLQPAIRDRPPAAPIHADLVLRLACNGAAPPRRTRHGLDAPAVARQDRLCLLDVGLHPVRRLLVAVHAEATERQGDAVEVRVLVELGPQLEVARELERG